ncbi:MAG: 4Fe-4S binding protein [Acidobacteriota bacterium]|nr:MAG: 4Fe-4S binding protein [Acidobacteriota bacterium]
MSVSTEKIDQSAAPGRPAGRAPLKPVANPITPKSTWHKLRRWIQFGCFLIFVALPFFNIMRFDIPKQRFYFAGYELWINEFAIIFFSLLFFLYVIAAASMLYGRVYCSYFCPQMIFSEASLALQDRIKRLTNKKLGKFNSKQRQWISGALFYSALLVASVFLSFVFIAYFVEPRDLLQRLLALDIKTYGGIAGASTTLITFLDFAFVRQRFCTTVCPYGYLQGMLGDKNTLLVEYRDPGADCIECKKCVRVCHMGIDIRKSPYQIECIHCGECIDACVDILGRFGKDGLIHYTWGEKNELLGDKSVGWMRRIGLRDAKRAVVVLVLLFYASGLFTALSMRKNVLVRIAPDRTVLYRIGDDGRIYNKFRLNLANRSNAEATVRIELNNLPNAVIVLDQPVRLKSGEELQRTFEVASSPGTLPQGVNHFSFTSRVMPDDESETYETTFITPTERKSR